MLKISRRKFKDLYRKCYPGRISLNMLSKSLRDLDEKYGPIYFTSEEYGGRDPKTYYLKNFLLPGVWFNVKPVDAYGINFGEIQVKLCDYSVAQGIPYRCDVTGGRFYQPIKEGRTYVIHPFVYNKYKRDVYSICLGDAENAVKFFNKHADLVGSADAINDVFSNSNLKREFLFKTVLRLHVNLCTRCLDLPENVTYIQDGKREELCNKCKEQTRKLS
jgi:hypothetical protein